MRLRALKRLQWAAIVSLLVLWGGLMLNVVRWAR